MTELQPKNRHLGNARVSTCGETLDAQLDQLQADRCAKVYREKASAARDDRRQLLLFTIVKQIVDAGGQFRSLAEPWADTPTSTGRLMIAILGGLADVERDLIRTRAVEVRSRAKRAASI
jgi:DNA invertase Pin-like site-specific DNA recombinase